MILVKLQIVQMGKFNAFIANDFVPSMYECIHTKSGKLHGPFSSSEELNQIQIQRKS